MLLYRILDIFFFVFHTLIILFVLTGWIWKPTRRAHLILVGLILVSWFGLGLFFGVGYCPCTEMHWAVRKQLSDAELPISYLKFLIDAVTGGNVNATLVDVVAFVVFGVVAGMSAWLNQRDFRLRRTQ